MQESRPLTRYDSVALKLAPQDAMSSWAEAKLERSQDASATLECHFEYLGMLKQVTLDVIPGRPLGANGRVQ